MIGKLKELLPYNLSRRWESRQYFTQIQRFGSETLNQAPANVLERADISRIERLWAEMESSFRADPASAAKYADHEPWLLFNVERAGRLGLHEAQRLRILDIGCGPAYFVAVARALGHECHGVDIPASYFTPVERRVYTELLESLRMSEFVSPLLIQRYQPLMLPVDNLDLITAFWICFNRHQQPDEWSVEEWRFFVDDAHRFLAPGGWLHLELNAHPERYGDLQWYDAPTRAYFESVGTVKKNQVRIQKRS